MKKSINKVKFLTVALVLSVLVSSCNLDDLLNKANTLFNNFDGIMDNTVATDSQVKEIKGSCKVEIYSSNESGITLSESITDPDLACSVNRPPSGGHEQAPREVWLAIANVKGVKKLAPKFLVSHMVDPGEFGIGDYLVPYDSAGNPLDSEGVVYQGNSTQQLSLIFLQATRDGWCFVKKKDPTKAYVVTFTAGKNVDKESPADTCDAESILAIAAAGDSTGGDPTGGTGNFVPDCTWVGSEGVPIRCVVNGNILNVTLILEGGSAVSNVGDFDASARSVTLYEEGVPKTTTHDGQTTTITFTTNTTNWQITVETSDTITSYEFKLGMVSTGDTGGTGDTGSFVPNCSWVSPDGNIPVRCVVNGNILNVTMLVPMPDETLTVAKLGDFDSAKKSVTTYGTDENGNETVTTMVSGQTRETPTGTVTLTYVFTVTAKNWKIEVQEGTGAIQPMFEFVLN